MSVLGAIALCVCKHKMCHQCHIAGNPSHHAEHNDIVFGNRGIYFVILFIWLWSFLVISFDAFNLTSVFQWSNTIYGCDVTYSDHTSYGMITNIAINLIIKTAPVVTVTLLPTSFTMMNTFSKAVETYT